MTSIRNVGERPGQRKRRSRETAIALGFLMPMLVLFIVFRVAPFFGGIGFAFGEFSLGGGFDWVGVRNFERLFSDPLFWQSLSITLVFTVLTVPALMIISIGMALLVRRAFAGVRVFRTIFFLPVITSLITAGVIFVWIFSQDGALPELLGALGLYDGSWLTNDYLAIVAVAIVAVWGRLGFDMLIVLARLQDISRELEEAAMLDGAGAWQRFRYVVLPELKPIMFFLSVIEVIGSFQVFDVIYVMTGGGPIHATYTLGFMLYDQAFKFFDFGYASAIAVVLFVIVLGISLVQRFLLDRDEK